MTLPAIKDLRGEEEEEFMLPLAWAYNGGDKKLDDGEDDKNEEGIFFVGFVCIKLFLLFFFPLRGGLF